MNTSSKLLFLMSFLACGAAVVTSAFWPQHVLVLRALLVAGVVGMLASFAWCGRVLRAADAADRRRARVQGIVTSASAVLLMGACLGLCELSADREHEDAQAEYDAWYEDAWRLGLVTGPTAERFRDRLSARIEESDALRDNGALALGSGVLSLLSLAFFVSRRARSRDGAAAAPTGYTQPDFERAASGLPR